MTAEHAQQTQLAARVDRSTRIIVAATVSSLGDGLLVSGLPLLANSLTDKGWIVTGVFAMGRLPWLFSPVIGAAVDRDGRPRRIMIAADLVRFAVLLILAAGLTLGAGISLLLVGAALLSFAEISFAAATWTMILHNTPREDLDKRNSQLSSVQDFGEHLMGPPLGGLLFRVGTVIPLVGDAVSFALSALLLKDAPSVVTPVVQQSFRQTLREGLSAVVRTPAIWVTTCWIAGIVFFHTMVSAALVLIAESYGFSNTQFTLILTGVAVGNLLGSLNATRLIKRLGSVELLILATLASGLMHIWAATADSAPLVIAALSFDGFAVVTGTIAAVGIRQRNAPPHLVGSVMATSRLVIGATSIPSSIFAGVLIDASSGRLVLGLVGVCISLLAVAGARSLRRTLGYSQRPSVLPN